MKTFRQLIKENQSLTEGGEMYPADDMTMKELKIACYAAQNILDRLEDGAMIQRWQISAIVKASEELSSVYISMSADEEEDEEEDSYYDDMAYDEYGNYYYESKKVTNEEDEEEDLQVWRDDKDDRIFDKSKYHLNKRGYPKKFDEEADFEVDVEGLPKMYVKANSQSEVKASLRKIVKKPDMIRGVERMTTATVKKIFRDKAAGKSEAEE
jgi:hypothetical protein